MKILKSTSVLATGIIILLLNHTSYAASFEVNIPDRASSPDVKPIRDVELFVDLPTTTTGAVNFRVSRESGGVSSSQDFTVNYEFDGALMGDSEAFNFTDDNGTGENDTVTISAVSTPETGATKRFKILMNLDTNWNLTGCSNRQDGDETWTVETLGTGATPAPAITAACVNSYEISDIVTCPRLLIQPANNPAEITPPSSPQIPAVTPCVDVRPPIDVMLVLDKSGSMSNTITGDSINKIDALNTAAGNFVDVWIQPGIATENDKLGVVLFDSNAQDWVVLNPGLNDFDDAFNAITSNTVSAAGGTSIGDGLNLAATHLTGGSNTRKIILLMSDGKQNSNRMAAVIPDDGTLLSGSDVDGDGSSEDMVAVTHNSGADYQALPGIEDLNIWSVSIGAADTDIDPSIFNALADTGTGFYLNSEIEPAELNLFFLELLQNFLRFNTIETTRLISDSIPITRLTDGDIGTAELAVSTTSTAKNISFSLMWDRKKQARFSMQIIPPAGSPISSTDVSDKIQQGPGFIRFTSALPLEKPYPSGSQIGDWKVRITVQGRGLGAQFPYQFYALADDDIVKTKFNIENRDYSTGDPIPLRAAPTEFRQPLSGKNSTLEVFATLIKPEDGIGNLLADNSTTLDNSLSPDTSTASQQKLDALLKENPDLLQYSSEKVPLFDDGLASHGDAVANDGIYNNLYKNTNKQGHYNFIFSVDGQTQASGPISRQQIETVYVRLKPDPDETKISSKFIGTGKDQQLVVSMTPRDQFGNRFGPGYANQFLVSPVNGIQPKFEDKNLDGVYEFRISASTLTTLPELDIRYVKPFIKVTDKMYPDRIPENLTEPFIGKSSSDGKSRSSLSFHLGTNVPHGSFSNSFDNDLSYTFDYERRLSDTNSLLIFAGQNRFDNAITNLDISNLSINAKHYFSPSATGSIRYFINGGAGYYNSNPGHSHAGVNLGGGAQLQIDSSYGIEIGYNYHRATNSADFEFSSFQLGGYSNF